MENKTDQKQYSDRQWQIASDRALLYLRLLNFPAPQALELALKAIKTAEHTMASDPDSSPTREVMRTLNELLLDERRPPVADRCACLTPSAPPLRRLPMISNTTASANGRSSLPDGRGDYRKNARSGL